MADDTHDRFLAVTVVESAGTLDWAPLRESWGAEARRVHGDSGPALAQLDETAARLAAAGPGDRETVRAAEVDSWTARIGQMRRAGGPDALRRIHTGLPGDAALRRSFEMDPLRLAENLRRYGYRVPGHVLPDIARSVRAAVEVWSREWRPVRGGPMPWIFVDDTGALRTARLRGPLITNPYADGIHPMSYLIEAVAERLGDNRCVTLAKALQKVRIRDLFRPSRDRHMRVVAVHRDARASVMVDLRFEPVSGRRRGVRFSPGLDAVLDEFSNPAPD